MGAALVPSAVEMAFGERAIRADGLASEEGHCKGFGCEDGRRGENTESPCNDRDPTCAMSHQTSVRAQHSEGLRVSVIVKNAYISRTLGMVFSVSCNSFSLTWWVGR